MRTTYTRKLTDAKYDADNPHCRECDCAACHYFAKVEKALDRAQSMFRKWWKDARLPSNSVMRFAKRTAAIMMRLFVG